MPPKKQQQVFMLVNPESFDEDTVAGVYATSDAAKAAAAEDDHEGFVVREMDVTAEVRASKAKATANTKAKAPATKKAKEPEPEPEDDEDEPADEDEAPPAKKVNPKKQIPEGKPNALEGAKLIFTGTMNMDRETSKATANKYGGSIVNKLEDTDYVVIGSAPGQKKIDEINQKGLETITEAEFYEILKTGLSADKRKRMASRVEAEPAKKKQKK